MKTAALAPFIVIGFWVFGIIVGWHYGGESARHDITMSCFNKGSFERHLSSFNETYIFSCHRTDER